jgi:hypothetical protein
MCTTNKVIFKVLHVIAWIIFVGLSIEAGGLLVNFIVSLYKPAWIPNLYQQIDLRDMYERSSWVFVGMYSYILFIAIMKAYLFYQLVIMLHKLDLSMPFNEYVANKITCISYTTFSIGLISYIGRGTSKNMARNGFDVTPLEGFWADSQAFILMAAVIYVIAVIFKRGVALQTENNLTV